MQHSGIPTKTHQQGYAARYAETAVHRTFQIKTFSTELKNHVMVMDFVKSNWFPSQRRAKVCIIHMCQDLKMAEQTASRYEIHSRLFSSPKDHSAWERNESLSNAGLRDNYHSRRDQIALKNLQSDVTEAKSDFTKETLASQNTKMISSIVISQMIDENKSRENRVSLPLPCAIAQSRAHHAKQSLANRSGVNIHRAFALLPGRLGIPAPSDERGPETELPPKEESPCGGPRRGFASITITARRVGPPASALVWGTVGDSLCPKCRAETTLFQALPALANGSHPGWHQRSFACTEFSRNSSVVRLKVPEAHTGLCERRKYWVTHADDKETSFSPDTPLSGKSPLVFSSCVHLRVSQQCPNSIYYVDKSLSVPIEPPQIASPKMHRSVLSLNLNCSSHRLTADGVDGLVNREPISGALKQELVEGDQDLVGQRWNPGLQESHLKETPSLGRVHSGTGVCPWSGSFPLENTELANVGANRVTVRKGEKDHATHCHASSHANQLSIHIPGWSYSAVHTKVFSGSSKRQQGEVCMTVSAPPVEQKPTRHFLPIGDSSPSNDCLSRDLSEPTERRHQSFLKPRILFPGFLCPLQDVCASPQEDNGVQIESKFPKGDYTCCDLVVKIKECKKSEDPTTPEPSPAAPSPAPSDGAGSPGLSEDCSEPQQTPARSLTLQEALEVRKPHFISRSQERLKKLEHMVQQRKAQRKEDLRQKQSLLPIRTSKKQFTIPHPLSDNLFKPKERCISEKEMHMRSKRIYNNLPEVKKKKEEQRKRVILQSNRLRAEVFKKQLLDQLLQRNAV
ncbi:(E2-independent) E3 ubiquitin-conjugating enzyme FATS isoform X1 [Hylobates moloch]|uniref:(E2-independent) E3 ubiquitin-conjugating enzyme FATS isoform X1 n=2 Tax=Hylobates moloch TaxID=81572 RepID=UPI0013624FB2|nr:(E2-independent) E3 ubiquitin-conjugating enzyme FATS isoform X1 [Hylobates moloch]